MSYLIPKTTCRIWRAPNGDTLANDGKGLNHLVYREPRRCGAEVVNKALLKRRLDEADAAIDREIQRQEPHRAEVIVGLALTIACFVAGALILYTSLPKVSIGTASPRTFTSATAPLGR